MSRAPERRPGDVRVNKRLAFVLRHDPASVRLTLAPDGWVEIPALLNALARHGLRLTSAQLTRLVGADAKSRYAIEGSRIRANQGHSVPVDLGLQPVVPPPVLDHGTAAQNVVPILAAGLRRGPRHHVHLSPDEPTARQVGARHGAPAVLVVDAGGMHRDGLVFLRSANGVWLTDRVPPEYLSVSHPTSRVNSVSAPELPHA